MTIPDPLPVLYVGAYYSHEKNAWVGYLEDAPAVSAFGATEETAIANVIQLCILHPEMVPKVYLQ